MSEMEYVMLKFTATLLYLNNNTTAPNTDAIVTAIEVVTSPGMT